MIHHVFATKSNIGDWLSARGIQSLLKPWEVTEHYCDAPFVNETLARLSELSPRDIIVVGGGGLMMDYFDPLWEGLRSLVHRVPVCIWGVGLVDLKATPSRASVQALCDVVRHSRFCSVRDALTSEFLRGCENVAIVPCPAIVTVESNAPEGYGMLYVDHYDLVGAKGYELIRNLSRAFASMTERPYHEIDNQISDGDEAALAGALGHYAEVDLIVSSRLHGCILGLSMGRRVLAISGDHKVESFMEAAGLREWVCAADDEQTIRNALLRLPTQIQPLEFLERARLDNQGIARRVLEIAE